MDKRKNKGKKRPVRRPQAEPVKAKAPHVKPRKNPPPAPVPTREVPEVVYLAPKPFSRSRLILRLATVVAVVLAVVLGLSIFFRIDNIEVSGCEKYTPEQIRQASGLGQGDQLLTFSIPRTAAKIIRQLHYIQDVRIAIRLPDTVKIEVVETAVTYALQAEDGSWWLMDASGTILEQCQDPKQAGHAVITGVKLESPKAGQQAKALQMPAQTDPDGNPIPITVTAAHRLDTVKQIAGMLEKYRIIGTVSSMDVTSLFEIELWYGDQYQVQLGSKEELDTKIRYLKSIIDDFAVNRPYESGQLDLSDPEDIAYKSFHEDGE